MNALRFTRLAAALFIALAATAGFAQTSVTLDATSGTGTISTNYTTTGTSGLTLSNGFFAEYLVVGGGGSGGTAGAVASNQNNWGTGGGGAGGMVSGTMQLSATSYTVTVGGGGAAPTYVSGSTSQGNNGANSVFGSVTAFGGGGGGGENSFSGEGASGGSGGGGGSKYSNAGGTGTVGQGNAGGAARAGDQSSAGNRTAGGGGGGAGGGGSAAVSTVAGNGGAGLASTITGTSVTYAGGGGGGAGDTFQTPTAGVGGAGGGGNGGVNTGSAGNGTDGFGGGGGGRGADGAGGRGGSGIVILRYQGASFRNDIGGTVTTGSGSAAGYTLHTFTTSGTTTRNTSFNLSGVEWAMKNRLGATLTGTISGSGRLTFAGPGRLTLAASNSFTGDTRITSWTLGIGNANALQNSTLDMNANDSGKITFSQDSNIGGLKGSRALSNGGKTLTIGGNNQSTTYSGVLSGAGGLTKSGTGALTLTGSSSFTGDTTVSAGRLVLGSGNALSFRAAVTVASGATLEATAPIRIGYIDSQGTVVGGENLTATLTVTRSGNIGGITDGTDSQGAFAAGIVKLGSGTSTVNAANTYTGLTWVREGTLAVGTANAFAAASDLTVDSGATLDRAGYSQTVTNAIINGTVGNSAAGGLLTVTGTLSGSGLVNGNMLVNGVHTPGNSPGIQTFDGNLSYGSNATINWELIANTASNSPVVFDQIVLSNASNLSFGGSNVLSLSFNGAGSLVNWNDSFWDVNQAWTVFDLASGVTTGFGNLSLGGSLLDANGLALDGATRGAFGLVQSGQDVVLQFTTAAIPEIDPAGMGSVLALVGGSLGVLERRRRRTA